MTPDSAADGPPPVKIDRTPRGSVIHLDRQNAEDLAFVRSAYGFEAEADGWFRGKRTACLSCPGP